MVQNAADLCPARGVRDALRFVETTYDVVRGRGYRPFRMVGWMAVTLAVFSVTAWLLGRAGCARALHAAAVGFLNPVTFGDLDSVLTRPARLC